MKIQNVLCPVDFSSMTDHEIDIALDVCRTFGAELIVEHNLRLAPIALAKGWEWESAHPEDAGAEPDAQQKLGEILARLPKDVAARGVISHGPMLATLNRLIETTPIDLVILGSHGWSTEKHASLGDRLIESCRCPVLAVHEVEEEHDFHLVDTSDTLPDVVVPIDFSETAAAAAHDAFELAREIPMRLHLVHVVEHPDKLWNTPVDHSYAQKLSAPSKADEARDRLRAMVPEDLADRVVVDAAPGSVSEILLAYAERVRPRLFVMGRHARGLFRRFFTHDHSRDMLHQAHCPVWLAGTTA